ncbi:MAG TPA: hypothetical protein VM029_00040, partial [Opitutaceae bacterium]|nr:hypothetical protein [Opitutaceae bacterium]
RTAARPVAWATGCGVLFGLAVAARPTFGAGALAAVLLMGLDPLMHRLRLRLDRRVLAAAAAGSVLVACLLAYNFARFGNVRQFGQDYQLSGIVEGAVQHFSFRFVPPQAWFYLFAPLRWTAYFPFFRDVDLPYYPPGFAGHEYSFGIFANFPITWFALAALVAAWRGTGTRGVHLAFAVGSGVALVPVIFWFGSCVRYQSEFTPALILLAACGVFEAERMAGARGRLVARLAFAFGCVSAVVAMLASVDMYNASANNPPRGFNPIGHLLNRPVIAWQHARGRDHGPVELTLRPGLATGQRELMVGTIGPEGETESVSIERAGAGRMRLIAQRTGPEPYEFSVIVDAAADDTPRLTVSMSSLYPIRPIELPSAIRPEDFRALKIWLRIGWNGRLVLEQPVPLVPWRAVRTQIAGANVAPTGAWPVFTEVQAHRRLELPSFTRERTVTGVRLAVAFEAAHVGRPFPLAVTGHHGRGNFLFVKVLAPDTLQFGYDHWGKPVLLSPPLTIASGMRHTIEFWMPSVLSAEDASPLVVRVDGKPAWTAAVPFYPAGAEEIFIARNPLGGSSCEREFPGVTIEELRLPPL